LRYLLEDGVAEPKKAEHGPKLAMLYSGVKNDAEI
jgi:hypothetical protein